MKILDRIFGGAKTTAKRYYSAFAGAKMSRLLMDWILTPLSVDKQLRTDLLKLRTRARDLARNNPYIRQYLALLTANVIGPKGIKMQAQVSNNNGNLSKLINDKIEAAWGEWGKTASACGRFSMTHLMQQAVRTLATDGEVFIRKVRGAQFGKYGFALQLVDADQVDHEYNQPAGDKTNEIRLGVEVSEWGRPVAFYLWDRHQSDANMSARKRIRVPAEDMLHLYDPDRANQTRGVTWFNSVMVTLHMFDGYAEAELIAARTAASKTGWFKYTDAGTAEMASEIPNEPIQMDAAPGSIEMLPPGLDFVPWDSSHPTTAYQTYQQTMLRQVASGLRVSYNAMANDLTGVNYSSLRSGLLIERDMWRTLQQLIIERLYQPIYEAWLASALLTGGLVLDSRDPTRFLSVKWTPRGWDWVDPLKDINASILAIQNGLSSRTAVLAETGDDFEETLSNLAKEQQLIADSGLTLGAADSAALAALAAQSASQDNQD